MLEIHIMSPECFSVQNTRQCTIILTLFDFQHMDKHIFSFYDFKVKSRKYQFPGFFHLIYIYISSILDQSFSEVVHKRPNIWVSLTAGQQRNKNFYKQHIQGNLFVCFSNFPQLFTLQRCNLRLKLLLLCGDRAGSTYLCKGDANAVVVSLILQHWLTISEHI